MLPVTVTTANTKRALPTIWFRWWSSSYVRGRNLQMSMYWNLDVEASPTWTKNARSLSEVFRQMKLDQDTD